MANHITRGQRLIQPQYISDELYMLMLQCWQNDLDERPTFTELFEILKPMVEDSSVIKIIELINLFIYIIFIHKILLFRFI